MFWVAFHKLETLGWASLLQTGNCRRTLRTGNRRRLLCTAEAHCRPGAWCRNWWYRAKDTPQGECGEQEQGVLDPGGALEAWWVVSALVVLGW
jgi:hypothetical protein